MQTQNRYFRGGLVLGVSLIITVLLLLAACGVTSTTTTAGSSAAPPTATGSQAALQVTSVIMAVTPTSIAGLACGTTLTVTYTATIHVAPNSPGGTVQFSSTVDNGRGQTPASITFNSGEMSKTYSFTWSGALPADHTAPGLGGIQVTSPNQLTSPLIAPTGQCAPVAAAPVCGTNFNGSGLPAASPSYQSILPTTFGTVPLPPLSRIVPDDGMGARGYDICSAGTAASVTAFMQQNLPAYGWTFVGNIGTSGGTESWQNSLGTINWSVPDPLDWQIYWYGPVVTPPACGANFNGDQSYQNTLTTAFGTVPLPPISRTVSNDASGGVRGYDVCSAGTAATITAFMQQNLPAYGWTFVSTSGGIQTWKSSSGTINWSVADPLEWNINWRVPLS
jgi:hypothetical protein